MAARERTAVVAVSSVQYATGSRVDVPRLRAATDAATVPSRTCSEIDGNNARTAGWRRKRLRPLLR